ncbi:hypothetical protein WMY93_024254 [Mugilogobius chulae]|uniref:Uncharacterized protein n=1 Tax=Mugilogobius chulae TaxID=88201 RepID=A0AAW0N4Q9_9GOBI
MIKTLLSKTRSFPDAAQQESLIQICRKVESQNLLPEGLQLKTKDLKTVRRAAAKSLLREIGSVSALFAENEDFTELALKQHLTIQLLIFGPNTQRAGFFSRLFKIFRKNRIPPGPLHTFLSTNPTM